MIVELMNFVYKVAGIRFLNKFLEDVFDLRLLQIGIERSFPPFGVIRDICQPVFPKELLLLVSLEPYLEALGFFYLFAFEITGSVLEIADILVVDHLLICMSIHDTIG